jgi:diguanylate cyclase (GGDEF)-like protein
MRTKLHTAAAVTAMSLAALLPSVAAAAGPLPDIPAPAAAPDVTVTPRVGDGGAGIDDGAGDPALPIGAGPAGLTHGTPPRGPSPRTTSPDADAGAPVSTPGDRRGRSGLTSNESGTPVLFGPDASAAAVRRARRDARRASGANRPRTKGRESSVDPSPSPRAGRNHLPPFLEFVDRIPTAVRLGLLALGLLALAVWGAWVRARRRLERNAFVDPVTGIANASALEGLVARELERARRYKRPLALLVVDVSDAGHGRLLGLHDQTLRDVTAAISERLREGDIVARLGPSRFAIISPEATAASAETLGRALELRLEEMRLHVAVGAAERQPTDLSAGDLLARAEAALAAPEAAHQERPRERARLRAA